MDEPRNRGQEGKDKDKHENRGRSDEARDPNRPVDPVTGEKEGLGPRTPEDEGDTGTVEEPQP